MNWTRVSSLTLTSIALVACAVALTGATFEGRQSAAKHAKQVGRGGYLATICGCNSCHTPGAMFGAPDFDRRLAGSELGWQGAWGVTFGRNLTPDKETGIGTWSEANIVKALRSGVRPDGSALLPPMKWQHLSALSDEDAAALAAYLKSIPAVHHKVPDTVPPGQQTAGSIIVMPDPSLWDVPKAPPRDETMKPGGADKK
jgi:mono/diheme cytochrome c family protein